MDTFPKPHIQKPDGDFSQDVHIWDFQAWAGCALPSIDSDICSALLLDVPDMLCTALQQECTEPQEPPSSVGGRYTLSYKSRFQAQKMQAVIQPVSQWFPAVCVGADHMSPRG